MSSRRSRSGGSVDGDDAEPVVEVLAEGAAPRTIAARSRLVAAMTRTSGVRVSRAAERLHLALLQHPQELDLQRRRHVADLVEEERAAVGLLEAARLVAVGPVKAPRTWPNSSRLEQRVGQRRAVDRARTACLAAGSGRGWRAPRAPCRCRSSPWMSTVASQPAMSGSMRKSSRMAGLAPMMSPCPALPSSSCRRLSTSEMSRKISTPPLRRPERSFSTAVETETGTVCIEASRTSIRTSRSGLPVARVCLDSAAVLADAGAEDLVAALADGLGARVARDALGLLVERGDAELLVDREHPLVDAVENDRVELVDGSVSGGRGAGGTTLHGVLGEHGS